MVDIKILLNEGGCLIYTVQKTEDIVITDNLMELITTDDVRVGIPIANIRYWETYIKDFE